jgi:hypothetical protein
MVSNTHQGKGGTMPHALHVAISIIILAASSVSLGVFIAWIYRMIRG